MTETIEQYKQRILSYAEGKDLLSVLSQTDQTLAQLVQGAPDTKLRDRSAPGKWSVAEILAHLADVEIVISWRIRSILGDPGIKIQAYDQDAWVACGHYEQREPAKSLELHRVLREANLTLLKSLTPDQWKQFGQHSERGQESVERTVEMLAGHDINHLQQIERILNPANK